MKNYPIILLLFLIVSCQTTQKETPLPENPLLLEQNLLDAIALKDTEQILYLLETGKINLNPEPDEYRMNNPLIYAVHYGNLEIVKLLLSYGSDIDGQIYNGYTALLTALERDMKTAEYLINQGADTNIPNEEGITAINRICSLDKPDLIKTALSHGSRINESHVKWTIYKHQQEEAYSYTAFQSAVLSNNYETVSFLLEQGGNPFIVVRGKNSFDLAKENGFTEILTLLNQYSPKDFTEEPVSSVAFNLSDSNKLDYDVFREEMDVVRVHHLLYYGELLDEYFQKTGHYPFQDSGSKNIRVIFATMDQKINFPANEDTTEISFKEFITELEKVLKRNVEEYYDPMAMDENYPLAYIYQIGKHHYFLTAYLYNSYSFSMDLKGIQAFFISNMLIPYKKCYTFNWINNNEEIKEFLTTPLIHGYIYEDFQDLYRYHTDEY